MPNYRYLLESMNEKKNQFPFLDVNSFPVLKFSYKFNLLFVKYMIEIFSFKQAFVRCV